MKVKVIKPTLTFHEACHLVIKHCPDGYAKSYARAGLGLHTSEEIADQCMYIMLNMRYWRGTLAAQCREVFKWLIC